MIYLRPSLSIVPNDLSPSYVYPPYVMIVSVQRLSTVSNDPSPSYVYPPYLMICLRPTFIPYLMICLRPTFIQRM
jgi:hypothetical protein